MDERTKRSLDYSLKDGVFASLMMGFSETFITPYALAMKASVSLIGILASMPSLVGSLLQVNSATLVERLGSRMAVINSFVLVHALMWAPIIAIPYIFKYNQAVYLIIFYTLLVATGAVAFPPWSSIMADYVPDDERGKVFGWRNRLFGIINVSSMFAAGFVLYIFKKFAPTNRGGFTVIFSVALIARLVSWHFITKMHEPELKIEEAHRFTFLNFLKRMRKTNFGRFVIFVSCMHFSVSIAAPFFAVYMLRDLKFNYLTYTVIIMAATLTSLLMMSLWGQHADHVGNRRVLRFTSIFVPIIPILWLFSHNPLYLISVQIFAGFFWSGFNLSASNFIYDAVTPEKRTRCIAYFNVINGMSTFSGAALGGCLVRILPPLFGYRIVALLVISGILRFFATFLSSFVREVRRVKDVSNLELFYSVIGTRSILSISSGKE